VIYAELVVDESVPSDSFVDPRIGQIVVNGVHFTRRLCAGPAAKTVVRVALLDDDAAADAAYSGAARGGRDRPRERWARIEVSTRNADFDASTPTHRKKREGARVAWMAKFIAPRCFTRQSCSCVLPCADLSALQYHG